MGLVSYLFLFAQKQDVYFYVRNYSYLRNEKIHNWYDTRFISSFWFYFSDPGEI